MKTEWYKTQYIEDGKMVLGIKSINPFQIDGVFGEYDGEKWYFAYLEFSPLAIISTRFYTTHTPLICVDGRKLELFFVTKLKNRNQ